MRVCLTGGAGFIGSHILAELLAERHEVLVIDNFANSSPESLRRVRKITDASFDILAPLGASLPPSPRPFPASAAAFQSEAGRDTKKKMAPRAAPSRSCRTPIA